MQRRLRTAAPSARPIATRAEVFAALLAVSSATIAEAAPPAPPASASASASTLPSGPPAVPAAPVGADGIPIVDHAPSTDDIPVPDLGTGATLIVRRSGESPAKPILYVDGRPVPPSAWGGLAVSPGTHEVVIDYPNGEQPLEKRRVSVAASSVTEMEFGFDPSRQQPLGGAPPIEHFGGSGCCGTHAPDQTATRAAAPAALLAAAIFVARRRRRPPPL